jgi:hypothetical protein
MGDRGVQLLEVSSGTTVEEMARGEVDLSAAVFIEGNADAAELTQDIAAKSNGTLRRKYIVRNS